jgi:hypothetical protein
MRITTMVTAAGIRSYVKRHFPGLVAQPSAHGCHHGSIAIFQGHTLVLLVDASLEHWGRGPFAIRLAGLGRQIRRALQAEDAR